MIIRKVMGIKQAINLLDYTAFVPLVLRHVEIRTTRADFSDGALTAQNATRQAQRRALAHLQCGVDSTNNGNGTTGISRSSALDLFLQIGTERKNHWCVRVLTLRFWFSRAPKDGQWEVIALGAGDSLLGYEDVNYRDGSELYYGEKLNGLLKFVGDVTEDVNVADVNAWVDRGADGKQGPYLYRLSAWDRSGANELYFWDWRIGPQLKPVAKPVECAAQIPPI